MFLKEAFRYQNFLRDVTDTVESYLMNPKYITKTTEEHLRKKANAEAEDTLIEVSVDRPFDCDNNQLVALLLHLLDEREKLSAAISAAKRSCAFDIDAELANNRVRQGIAAALRAMVRTRASESIDRGTAYKFNGEGNQVPYSYDVKRVTTIDFDRNKVRNAARVLADKSDKVSADIDSAMLQLTIDYEPEYNVSDQFEDIVEQFVSASHS